MPEPNWDIAYQKIATRKAYCPQCSGEMQLGQLTCPHCEFDFPQPPDTSHRNWPQLILDLAMLITAVAACWLAFLAILNFVASISAIIQNRSDFSSRALLSFAQICGVIVSTALCITFRWASKLQFESD